MSVHDILILKMMAGIIISGLSLSTFAYGAGLIYRSWGWWNVS